MAEYLEPNEETTVGAWPQSKEQYILKEMIGSGSSAKVYAAFCKPLGQKCAIKCINLEKPNTLKYALVEIEIMKSCEHENIVKYYTSFRGEEEYWLVISLSEGGTLFDVINNTLVIKDCTRGLFNGVTIARVLKEILKGLEYLHNTGRVHRDIKPENVLINKDGTIQIADLGLSASFATEGDTSHPKVLHQLVGSTLWTAPEIIEKVKGYDFKADIWSVGILAIEMATGFPPYEKCCSKKARKLILKNDPPTLETASSEKKRYKRYGILIREMIAECLQKDPARRPTAAELLKHQFFRKSRDKKFLAEILLTKEPSIKLDALSLNDSK